MMLDRRRSLALALLISPIAFSQATVSTSVSLTIRVNATVVRVNNTSRFYSGSGTGVLQPFGNVAVVLSTTDPCSGLGAGTMNLTFQSGDSLNFSFISNGPTLTPTVTSGTGQFSGATGSLDLTGYSGTESGDGTCPASYTSTDDLTFSGTIVQQASAVKPASAAPSSLTFNFAGGATAAASQSITLSNGSASNKTFTASVSGAGGALSLSPASGTVPPFTTVSVPVTARPSGLAVGTYTGAVAIAFGSGESFSIPVTYTVTNVGNNITVGSWYDIGYLSAPDQYTPNATVGGRSAQWIEPSQTTTGGGTSSSPGQLFIPIQDWVNLTVGGEKTTRAEAEQFAGLVDVGTNFTDLASWPALPVS